MLMKNVGDRGLLSRKYKHNMVRPGLVALLLMGLSSPSRAQISSSANQLAITDALLSAHCVPASPQNNTLPFQSDAISRTLTIQGFNFLNGATPLVTLGNVGLPLTLATPPTATTITVNFDCSQFSTGTYRLHVSTGSGTPYNGDFYFSFSTQGPAGLGGAKGDPGVTGPQGPNGLSGNNGKGWCTRTEWHERKETELPRAKREGPSGRGNQIGPRFNLPGRRSPTGLLHHRCGWHVRRYSTRRSSAMATTDSKVRREIRDPMEETERPA